MAITRKILFVLIVTGNFALSTELEAISITNDLNEIEFLKSAPNGMMQSNGLLHLCSGFPDPYDLRRLVFDHLAIVGLNNEAETLSGKGENKCVFDPEHCGVRTTLNIGQRTSTGTAIRSRDSSNENSEATSLLLLILGLLGISRLRGRAVK